jgi:hypothetical protein
MLRPGMNVVWFGITKEPRKEARHFVIILPKLCIKLIGLQSLIESASDFFLGSTSNASFTRWKLWPSKDQNALKLKQKLYPA